MSRPGSKPEVHRCHATSCEAMVPRHLLMCKPHWSMVPRLVKADVYSTFRRSDKREWLLAIEAARVAVAEAEGVL